MSRESILLRRRWPERRPVVLAAASLAFVAIAASMLAGEDSAPAVAVLVVLPVLLAALELGLPGGLLAAALAIPLLVATDLSLASHGVALVALGAIAGRFSDRMRAGHTREQRLLDSGLAIAETATHDRLLAAVATAAIRTPGAVGVVVELEGGPTVVIGGMEGERTVTEIVARGARHGRIVLRHRTALADEDRTALELLALQAGLAVARNDLAAQRSGLGQVIEAQENDRRRLAETLHEELAQALAAVLLGLRLIRRHRPEARDEALDELYGQVAGVLDDLRTMASELRPTTLAHLGLVPALEALRPNLAVDAEGILEPLPEAIRTGVYRMVEHTVSAADPGSPAAVRLRGSPRRLDVLLDVDLDRSSEPVAAARAQVALMNGSFRAERSPDRGTRLRVRLPVSQPVRSASLTS